MLSSIITLRPLRRCLFSIIGGYAMTALYFQTLDNQRRNTLQLHGIVSKQPFEQPLVFAAEIVQEYAALSAFLLACIVISRGTSAISGAACAVATHRGHEVADLQAKCQRLRATIMG